MTRQSSSTTTRETQRQRNRSRLEIRSLECLEVNPAHQVGFPGARLETRVRRKGKWCREVVFLFSSVTLEEL